MVDFFAGCLGGMAGVVVGHPLDTVKVHMQTEATKKYTSTWSCLTALVRSENIRSLYKGMTSPLAGVGLVNAVVFGVYGFMNRHFTDNHTLTSHLVAGSTAGLIQSLISSPIELAKTRVQLQHGKKQFRGPFHCLQHIYKTEGIRGTMRGFTMTAMRDVPGFATYFVGYEYLMSMSQSQSGLWTLFSGGMAGIFSWICCYPFDVVKTNIQASVHSSAPQYKNGLDCAIQNYKMHGYRYFFRGLESTLIRAFPVNGTTFFVVAFTLQLINGKNYDLVVNTNESLSLANIGSVPICHVHQIDCEDKEAMAKRKIMARHLRALGAFNEAVHHNEVDELANEFYPDSNKYYVFEDKRLTDVEPGLTTMEMQC